MRRLTGLGMLTLVLLPAAGANAASTTRRHLSVSLSYQRRPGAGACPSEAELRREVKAILGYSPFVKSARTSLSCVLWTDAAAQHARIQLRDRRTKKLVGQRDLSTSGPGCEQLGSAVALAIALAVDPLAKPPPRPEIAAAAPVVGSPPPPPVPATPPPRSPTRAGSSTGGNRAGASRASGGKGASAVGATASVGAATSTVASVGGGQARPLPDAGTGGTVAPLATGADAGIVAFTALPDAGIVSVTVRPDAGTLQPRQALADAGTLLGLAPLLLVPAPDAGAVQGQSAAPDAGAALALAPLALAKAADAGSPASTASAQPSDAGVPPPAAVVDASPDAGVNEPEAGAAGKAPETAAAPGHPWHVFAGAEGDLTRSLMPSTAFGASLFVGVAWPSASVELEARWIPATSIAYQGGHISSSLFTVGASGCALFGPWGACGVVDGGPFSSSGSGYPQSIETSDWVVSLGARAQWTWVFANPVGLRLHVDGLVNLIRPRLLVNASQAWEAPAVGLAVGAGLYARF